MATPILRVGLAPCLARFSTARLLSKPSLLPTVINPRLAPPRRLPLLWTAAGIAGAALGCSSLHCDGESHDVPQLAPALPPPPKSSVNALELTFGTACGVCAGVFIKKSARMVGFFLGGLFVVLQYLGSMSLVKVDWAQMGSRFENLFYTTDAVGNKKPPSVRSIWKWVVDFLTADFQPRASFVAGLALGLRVG